MPDVKHMSALDLLEWLGTQRRIDDRIVDSWVRTCVAVGRTDLDDMTRLHDALSGPAGAGLMRLWRAGHTLSPAVTDDEIAALEWVPFRVLIEDRDNVEEWAAFGKAWEALRPVLLEVDHRNRYGGGARSPHDAVDDMLDAGRGPHYAHDMLTRARATGLRHDALGLDVEPQAFTDLASAGVTSPRILAEWERALDGLTLGEPWKHTMLRLASAGVASTVAVMARHEGVPVADWGRYAEIPAGWVCVSSGDETNPRDTDGPIDPPVFGHYPSSRNEGWTLDDLAYVATRGWAKTAGMCHPYGADEGKHRGAHASITLTGQKARDVADHGALPADVARLAVALMKEGKVKGRSTYARDRMYSLTDHRQPSLDVLLDLWGRGLRPSHLSAFRSAGARSVDDVRIVLEAGLTGADVARLVAEHGTVRDRYDKQKTLPSIARLISLHRDRPKETQS